jgi:predicted nucleic acid-binding protein
MAFAVVLDANVLYPIALTDFFLTLAGRDLYRPHWSTEILREVQRNLLRNHPSITQAQLDYRFQEMNRAHPAALIDPPAPIIDVMTNDPKDRHVLATAIVCSASVIVTFNTQHFRPDACQPYGVEAQHPDVFAEHLVDLDQFAVRGALDEMSARTRAPQRTVPEIIARLAQDLPNAMRRLDEANGAAQAQPAPAD